MTQDVPDWLTRALGRIPLPDAPVTEPWECSVGALVSVRLPRLTAIDRIGAVHLSPLGIGFDAAEATPWSQVREVRTRPLGDAIAARLVRTAGEQSARWAPLGTKTAARLVASRVTGHLADALAGLEAVARRDGSDDAVVPCAVVHGGRWRPAVRTPSAAASALLWLPAVAASVIATARAHGVPVLTGLSRP